MLYEAKSKYLSREIGGQTVTMLPIVLHEALFMAESPDRRLIEPAANTVNETLLRELFGARWDVEEAGRRHGPRPCAPSRRWPPAPTSLPTRASVPEPDRPNEKDSSMSSGFCLKWVSTERRTISASVANGFFS